MRINNHDSENNEIQTINPATEEVNNEYDLMTKKDVMEIAKEYNVPVLCNIHDVQLAKEFCNKIIGLQDGIKKFDGPTSEMNEETLNEIYALEVL